MVRARQHGAPARDPFRLGAPAADRVRIRQTWSSALFVSSFLTGAVGLKLDAEAHTLTFAPALPSDWNRLDLDNLRIGQAQVSVRLRRSKSADDLALSGKGTGPLALRFMPQEPGERRAEARLDGQRIVLHREGKPIALTVKFDGGSHHLAIRYREVKQR